jgi:hypothetical protein
MATNLSGSTVASTFSQLLHVDGGPTATEKVVYGGGGASTALKVGSLSVSVGNLRLDGNTLSSINTNGDINIAPGGTGEVNISKANITGGTVAGVSLSGISSATFNGSAQTSPETVSSSGGTLTINCVESNVFSTTLTENVTLVVSNGTAGQTINVLLVQGATARTVSWPASFKWPAGTAPSVTASANAEDLLVATFIGSYWYASLIKGFS